MAIPILDQGAIISECGNYRYQLWRIWNNTKPNVLFIMLNPSTADTINNDPTIRRCIGFAKTWGFGGLYVGNLFAYRSTDHNRLKWVDNPVGVDNILHINEMASKSVKIVLAWGGNGPATEIKSLYGVMNRSFHCMGITKSGEPKHPLYLKKNLSSKPFNLIKIANTYVPQDREFE